MFDPRYKLQYFNEADCNSFRRLLEKIIEKEAISESIDVVVFLIYVMYQKKRKIYCLYRFTAFFIVFFDLLFLPLYHFSKNGDIHARHIIKNTQFKLFILALYLWPHFIFLTQ